MTSHTLLPRRKINNDGLLQFPDAAADRAAGLLSCWAEVQVSHPSSLPCILGASCSLDQSPALFGMQDTRLDREDSRLDASPRGLFTPPLLRPQPASEGGRRAPSRGETTADRDHTSTTVPGWGSRRVRVPCNLKGSKDPGHSDGRDGRQPGSWVLGRCSPHNCFDARWPWRWAVSVDCGWCAVDSGLCDLEPGSRVLASTLCSAIAGRANSGGDPRSSPAPIPPCLPPKKDRPGRKTAPFQDPRLDILTATLLPYPRLSYTNPHSPHTPQLPLLSTRLPDSFLSSHKDVLTKIFVLSLIPHDPHLKLRHHLRRADCIH